jgi:hypothetical protein
MTKANTTIVREYVEEVFNRKNFDSIFEFCDKKCLVHVSPYVGTGINPDESSGEKVVVMQVASHGPAFGHLQVGDVLMSAHDHENTWDTFDQMKSGLWGQGTPGTTVTFTVERNGKTMTVPVTRSRIDGLELKLTDFVEMWSADILKNWPDLQTTIEMVFGDHDLVTCYTLMSGTNTEYHRTAIWSGINIYRLHKGKITDIWGIDNELSQMKQLGYQIRQPAKETVR